jgi:hypothetical protein
LVPSTVKLLHLYKRKGKGKSMEIRRVNVAGLAWNRLLMRVDNSTGKAGHV